jgi:hypothetical protein
MALPSRDQTFAYETCRDLVEKLDREIDRYCAVAGNDEGLDGEALLNLVHQLTDSAFNASVTAWHICDWVFNDLTLEQRNKLEYKKRGDLQRYVRKQCRALYICQYAANASKHWQVTDYPDPTVEVIVTGEAGWTIYFVDKGKKIPAAQVFMAARDFWDHFIRENYIAKTLDDRAASATPDAMLDDLSPQFVSRDIE